MADVHPQARYRPWPERPERPPRPEIARPVRPAPAAPPMLRDELAVLLWELVRSHHDALDLHHDMLDWHQTLAALVEDGFRDLRRQIMALTQTEQDALAKLQTDIDAVVQAAKGSGGGTGDAVAALQAQVADLTAQKDALTAKLGAEDDTVLQLQSTIQQQQATVQQLQDAATAQEQDVTAALGSLDAHVQELGGPPKAGFVGAPPASGGLGNTGTGPDGAFLGVEAPADPTATPAPVPSAGDAGAATVAPPDAGTAPVVSPDALVQGASQQATDAAGNVIDAATGQPISGTPSA